MLIGSNFAEWKPNVFRTFYIFDCDGCGKRFERRMKKSRRDSRKHFCTNACANQAQKAGGPLDLVRRAQFRANLDVDYPMQSAVVRQKSMKTCIDRYGVENVQQDSEIKHKSCETFLANLQKRQKCLGLWVSKAENLFYESLLVHFEQSDIVRQKRVKPSRRPIDFWIKSIDTYIQFDGVYWHGLDRPLSKLAEGKTKHDQEIYIRYLLDREQDEFFRKKELRLVRITDVEYDSASFESILNKIRGDRI